MLFELLCKDDLRAEFELNYGAIDVELDNLVIHGNLPIGCTESNLLNWLDHRSVLRNRVRISGLLKDANMHDLINFLCVTHGVSLNDCFWVRDYDNNDCTWSDVNPYTNDFDNVLQDIAFATEGNIDYISPTPSPEYSTDGAFAKCWVRESNGIYLYKRGSKDSPRKGREPFNEVIASTIYSKLKAGIPYTLKTYKGFYVSRCKLFTSEKVSFVQYKSNNEPLDRINDILKYYKNIDQRDTINRILISDSIVYNIDRHAGNHGSLYNADTNVLLGCAPGFDYNLALMPLLSDEDLLKYRDITKGYVPRIGQDFVGLAKYLLTDSIRSDLVNIRGHYSELPEYTENFTERRCKCLNDIMHIQIENILRDGEEFYPPLTKDGLSTVYKYRMQYGFTDDKEWQKEKDRLTSVFNIKTKEDVESVLSSLLK